MPRTELFLFESAYGRDVFAAQVGQPRGLARVVHNGVAAAEFAAVIPAADATDVVYVGELRTLKGVDVLIDAIGLLAHEGQTVSATIVGDGPDAAQFRGRAEALGLSAIHFTGALPARTGFARGRILVVPSRAESLPYIVLEGGAAGRPIVATAVGGMGEIFGPDAARLVAPANARALADAVRTALADPQAAADGAARLQARIRAGFSVDAMTDQVLAAYQEARA
jgi:glycosyltransferase involved in cell wall biosynthesis